MEDVDSVGLDPIVPDTDTKGTYWLITGFTNLIDELNFPSSLKNLKRLFKSLKSKRGHKSYALDFVFQIERCPLTSRLHFHTVLHTPNETRIVYQLTEVLKPHCPQPKDLDIRRIHSEKGNTVDLDSAYLYVTKSQSRVAGPILHGFPDSVKFLLKYYDKWIPPVPTKSQLDYATKKAITIEEKKAAIKCETDKIKANQKLKRSKIKELDTEGPPISHKPNIEHRVFVDNLRNEIKAHAIQIEKLEAKSDVYHAKWLEYYHPSSTPDSRSLRLLGAISYQKDLISYDLNKLRINLWNDQELLRHNLALEKFWKEYLPTTEVPHPPLPNFDCPIERQPIPRPPPPPPIPTIYSPTSTKEIRSRIDALTVELQHAFRESNDSFGALKAEIHKLWGQHNNLEVSEVKSPKPKTKKRLTSSE